MPTFDEELFQWLGDESPSERERDADRMLGAGEWDGLIGWLRERALTDHRIDSEDLEGLHLVDEPAEVVRLVRAGHERQRAARRGRARDAT